MYQLWNRNPFTNIAWVLSSVLVIVIQLVYCTVSILLSADSSNEYHSSPGISDIPVGPLVLTFLFPLLLLPINELIKRREIRVNVRYQKRARLEFGTKLGMNSPF
ncbi:Transmembrane protein 94 [Armadillidium vulgare]|nr:Transmembrane protein 94 [Armadillidium vulgare]